jgi:hypothetical protein
VKTIEATAKVTEDGTLTVKVPTTILPGAHRVVLVIEEQPKDEDQPDVSDFPVHDFGPWPADLSLRREDMYDDWGR